MKKNISLFAVLLLTVLCSACVNDFAVSKLNRMAEEFVREGDYKSAISRLEASVDLDGNIYESRFNLAVAYMNTGDCYNALQQINVAQTLVKDEAGVYYMQGISNECLASELIKETNVKNKSNDNILTNSDDILKYITYLDNSNAGYERYLILAPNTERSADIISHIKNNRENIKKYSLN